MIAFGALLLAFCSTIPGTQQLDLAAVDRDGRILQAIDELRGSTEPTEDELQLLAWLEQQAGDPAASIATLQRLLALRPGHRAARELLAYADWHLGQARQAQARLRELLDDAGGTGPGWLSEDQLRRDLATLDEIVADFDELRPARSRLRWCFLGSCGVALVLLGVVLVGGWRQ